MTTTLRVPALGTLLTLLIAAAHAGALTGQPVCLSKFDTNCAALTPGGYTVLTTVSSPNGTMYIVVDAVLTGGVIVNQQQFLAGDPSIQSAVLQDDAQLASSPPACSGAITSNCYAGNVGGAVIVTSSTTSTFVNVDKPVNQRLDQYSTTLRVTLNGTQTILLRTFGAGFNDPGVQAALLQAEAVLAAGNATFGSPRLSSNSTVLLGSQLSYVVTGQHADGNTLVTTSDIFGPAVVHVGDNQSELFYVLPAQLDINVNTNIEFAVDRNAVTTNTFLTTQTYEVDGVTSPSATPEPATWALTVAGVLAIALRKRLS